LKQTIRHYKLLTVLTPTVIFRHDASTFE